MRRMLISVAGGLGLPIAFYYIADSLGAYLYDLQMRTTAKAVVYAFGWPLILWDWIFGRGSAECSSCISPYAIVAAVITYFVFFALLTYLAQVVIEKFWTRIRPVRNVSLSERRA